MSSETHTILVPIDGSDQSRKALMIAATEFNEAELVILYVQKPFVVMSVTESAVWDEEFLDHREREAKQLLEEYRELAASYGVDVQTELAHGSPKRAIIEASEKFDADHIIKGYTRKPGLNRIATLLTGR